MGNPLSTSRTLPWTHLRRPTSITLLGLEQTGKTALLTHLSSQSPSTAGITPSIPVLGLYLETLSLALLTITALTIGLSKPKAFTKDVEAVRENCDGILLMVDCRDEEERRVRLHEEVDAFVLAPPDCRGAPLLVLANWWDAKGAATPAEIEQGLRAPAEPYYRGIPPGERPLAVKRINAATSEGVSEALEWLVDAVNTRTERPNHPVQVALERRAKP